jgi:hypothetical protein
MIVSRRPQLLGSIVLAVVVACSACGSSSPSVGSVRTQVLAVFTTANADLAKAHSANAVTADAGYAKAFQKAAAAFRAIQYPASAQHAADHLESVLDVMGTEAEEVSKAAALNQKVLANVKKMADINLKLIEEEKVEHTAANALRADIGLPAETTTTTPPASTTTTAPAVLKSS